MTDGVLSREQRVEEFGERFVEHTEWSREQRQHVQAVLDTAIDTLEDIEGVELAKYGTSVNHDGLHEGRVQFRVAGDPWEFTDGDEVDVYRCGGCERIFEEPVDGETEHCPYCGTPTHYEDTGVRTVVF